MTSFKKVITPRLTGVCDIEAIFSKRGVRLCLAHARQQNIIDAHPARLLHVMLPLQLFQRFELLLIIIPRAHKGLASNGTPSTTGNTFPRSLPHRNAYFYD